MPDNLRIFMKIFTSTRQKDTKDDFKKIDFKEAILHPNAAYGGLWALESLPQIDFEKLYELDYNNLTKKIFKELHLDIKDSYLDEALSSYESFDNPNNPAPLTKINDNLYIQELYHGLTRAFKDMALAPFGKLFSDIAKEKNQKYLILAATSGDTGPATLQSFANKENISVICLYPKGGTSDVQALQMTTQNARNLKVIAIEGNFDDAQSALKSLLKDKDFEDKLMQKEFSLSAANSVNFGRIAFQIIYHIWGYFSYIKNSGEKFGKNIDLIIPSGNFGNALGAFYAKKMGLPIHKIIIASNPNNILTEFIQTGIYDIRNKMLIKSYSPAMDILKSSNVERVLFELFGAVRTKELMDDLEQNLFYELKAEELKELQNYFSAYFCTDKDCLMTIKEYFEKGYLIDPHTAIALNVYHQAKDQIPVIVASSAEWSKFSPTIAKAIFNKELNDKESIKLITTHAKISLHKNIQNLFDKDIIHNEVLDKSKIKEAILDWL